MFESEVGAKVAAIRQKLGTGNWGNAEPSGAVYVPAGTDSAAVMVVSGRVKLTRLAQESPTAVALAPISDAVSAVKRMPYAFVFFPQTARVRTGLASSCLHAP